MVEISYEDLSDRLTLEALDLLRRMLDAHLSSKASTRSFIRSDTNRGTRLMFTGSDGATGQFPAVDVGALEDLVGYGLLHVSYSASRGTPNYRVSGEAVRFNRWLVQEAGTAIAQVDEEIRRLVSGDAFAAAHPGAAHHLAEALALLWAGDVSDQRISEIGDHLRKALFDTTAAIVGAGAPERPIQQLRTWLAASKLQPREAELVAHLVDFADAALKLDHRLNHVRDEAAKGEPPPTWEEARRAAFLTAVACHELAALPGAGAR